MVEPLIIADTVLTTVMVALTIGCLLLLWRTSHGVNVMRSRQSSAATETTVQPTDLPPAEPDVAADEEWLARLKAACDAAYYKTEPDLECQTPIPFGDPSRRQRHSSLSLMRRLLRQPSGSGAGPQEDLTESSLAYG